MTEAPLYVCDLDGTLLGPDATLSEFSREGLNRLLEAGIQLTIASSRRTVDDAGASCIVETPAELPASVRRLLQEQPA